MKLYDNKKIILIIISIIVGLLLFAYITFEQKGSFGKTDIISMIITAFVGIIISFIIIKKGNK
jgi:hypothetical protein